MHRGKLVQTILAGVGIALTAFLFYVAFVARGDIGLLRIAMLMLGIFAAAGMVLGLWSVLASRNRTH